MTVTDNMLTCNCEGCELKSLFFENVSTLEIESICSRKVEREYQKGEIIIREGAEIHEFIYLKSGLVKLYHSGSNSREQIICFALPLDFVSLLSIFSEKRYIYSVAALEDSITCNIKMDEIISIATGNGRFALSLIEKVNKATDRIILDFLEVKQKRLYGRIAYILLYFAKSIYKSNSFDLPVSRKEIAEYIGMTVENVIRSLSDLRKDGIIKIFGPKIEIVDEGKLARIAELS
ncbi:MAG: Crp/Fnr family transcriptional regulator [Bacteroidales bacterium]|nr:Crp/Fnr family transcriptional regulator [Bacteroidales bacterium]